MADQLDPKIQEKLNKLKAEEVKLNKQIAESMDTGTLVELTNLQQKLNQLVAKQNKLLGISSKTAGELYNNYSSSVTGLKDIGSELSVLAGKDSKRIKNAQAVNLESRLYATLSKDASKNTEKISRWSGATHEHGKGIVARAVAASKVYDASEAAVNSIASAREGQVANEASLGNELLQNVDATESSVAARKAALALQANATKMTKTEYDLAVRRVDYLKQSADQMEIYAAATERNIGLSTELGSSLMTPFEGIKGAIEGLPGGGMLSKALGLDQFNDVMKGAVTKSIQVGLVDGPKAGIANFKKLIGSQKIFNLTAMMNPYVAVAAVLLGLVALLASITKEAKEHAKATGLSVGQAKEQVKAAKELQGSLKNNLATTEDIVSVQKEMVAEFGRADMISEATTLKLADMGATLGYGAGTAAEVANTLMTVGGASEELAANMQVVAFNMAEAAGVAPGKVMKDMAKNGKLLAKSMAGNAKGMMEVAVYAAQLGTDISGILKMTDGLLDIESSLTAQMEYQAISGKSVNLEKARQLKAMGKEKEAAEEMARVLAEQGDISKMAPIERQKLAKMMGMEVHELQRMAMMQEKMNNMTQGQKDLVNQYGDALGDVSNMTAQQMLDKAADIQATEKMGVAFEKIKNTLITALMPAVEAIGEALEALSPVFDILGVAMKIAFLPLKWTAKLLGFVVAVAMRLLQPFIDVGTTIMGLFDGTASFGDLIKSLGALIINSILAPFRLVYAFLGELFGWPENFGMAIIDSLGGAFDWLMSGFRGIGDFISNLFTGIIDVLKSPFNMLISGANAIINGLNGISVTVPNWVPFIGGKELGFSIPTIPMFETGGTVAETGMAVVHEGEIITPASKVPRSEGGLANQANQADSSESEGGSTLGNIASSVMAASPLGMIGSALGGLFGGGDDKGGGSDPALTKAIQDLNAILSSGIMATVSAEQAADAVNTSNSYKT